MSDDPKPTPQPLAYHTPSGDRRPMSTMASASMVLGTLGFIPLVFIPGIICAVSAIKATRDPGVRGRGLAIAGLVLGILWGMLNVAAVPATIRARQAAQQSACLANLRQLGMGLMMYANQNRGFLPPDLGTMAADVKFNLPQVFVCPATTDTPAPNMGQLYAGGHLSYTYVGTGTKLNTLRPSSQTILVYETTPNHRNGGMCALFADGHCEALDKQTAAKVLADVAAGKIPPVLPPAGFSTPAPVLPTTAPRGQ